MTGDEFVTRNTPHLAAMRKRAGREGSMSYDPCISRQTPLYMHRPDVLAAIHASSHPNPRWPSDQPGWAYGDEKEDIALLFPKFFKQAPHWNIGARKWAASRLEYTYDTGCFGTTISAIVRPFSAVFDAFSPGSRTARKNGEKTAVKGPEAG